MLLNGEDDDKEEGEEKRLQWMRELTNIKIRRRNTQITPIQRDY